MKFLVVVRRMVCECRQFEVEVADRLFADADQRFLEAGKMALETAANSVFNNPGSADYEVEHVQCLDGPPAAELYPQQEPAKPSWQTSCSMCGNGKDLHIRHRLPGEIWDRENGWTVREKKPWSSEFLKFPDHQVQVVRECLTYHCRVCGFDWETMTLKDFSESVLKATEA